MSSTAKATTIPSLTSAGKTLAFSCSGPKTSTKSLRPEGSWNIDQPISVCTLRSPSTSRNNADVASNFGVRVPRKQIR